MTQELDRVVDARLAPRVAARLAEAAHAYERGRYPDALRMVTSLRRQAAGTAAVKELHGLILYQMGHWREAIKELGDYHRLTLSVDQYPVVADCHRALRHYKVVEEIWAELRRDSAAAEVLTEARLVVAGTRADQGNFAGAIALLDGVRTDLRNPKLHHLRQWYALADLYERSGEIPKARDLFGRVVRFEADFYDAAERLAGLG
ncbi:MAG: tetratricopeptide repeat protein [Acidimicrobiales bacterium]